MNREIRELTREHIDAYAEIAYNAYPSFKDFSKEAMDRYKRTAVDILENDSAVTFYGLFEDETLIAVMRLFDFEMNCFGKVLPASGLGFLGVHLMHKKTKAARAMVEFYEELYRRRGVPIASLLPFRPDFYKQMGYGIGTKMNQYRLATQRIPAYYGEADIRWLGQNDLEEMLACHDRVVKQTHGMMRKIGDEIRNAKEEEFDRWVGCYEDGTLSGYLTYRFENGRAGNYTQNNVYVKELICENSETLKKLLGFLRKQEDQVQLVIFNTEDEYFSYLFDNPINDVMNYIPFGYIESNTQAVGVMYKVLDVPGAFRQCAHRNYNGADLTVRFQITEAQTGAEEETVVRFSGGRAEVLSGSGDPSVRAGGEGRTDPIDPIDPIEPIVQTMEGSAAAGCAEERKECPAVTVKMGIADFSSLFMGSVSVLGLFRLGRLAADREELLDDLDRAFYCSQKPVCYTDF